MKKAKIKTGPLSEKDLNALFAACREATQLKRRLNRERDHIEVALGSTVDEREHKQKLRELRRLEGIENHIYKIMSRQFSV